MQVVAIVEIGFCPNYFNAYTQVVRAIKIRPPGQESKKRNVTLRFFR